MRDNYNRVEFLENTAIVIGLASVGLLWVFCVVGALHAFWNTIGEHMLNGIERFRRHIRKR